MIEVPIFQGFDFEKPVGFLRLEDGAAEYFMSCGAIVPSFSMRPEGKELLAGGLVDRAVVDPSHV